MIHVTEVRHLGGYRLWVRFSDATEGEVDLGELILNDQRPIVAALRDPAAFAAMRVDMDTVVWNSGFDLAPEYLHLRAKLRRRRRASSPARRSPTPLSES